MIHKRRHLVIEQIVVERFSRLLIPQEFFRQCISYCHALSAVDLTGGKCRVDHLTAVMDIDDIEKSDPAHRYIHFNFSEAAAE